MQPVVSEEWSQNKKLQPHCITKQTAPHETALLSSVPKNCQISALDLQIVWLKSWKPHCITKQRALHEGTF